VLVLMVVFGGVSTTAAMSQLPIYT
jgi:hypothetical protein